MGNAAQPSLMGPFSSTQAKNLHDHPLSPPHWLAQERVSELVGKRAQW